MASDMPAEAHQNQIATTDISSAPSTTTTPAPVASPVEINSAQTDSTAPIGSTLDQSETHKTTNNSSMPYRAMRSDTTTAILSSQNPPTSPPPLPTSESPKLDRTQSTAIGPSSDSAPTQTSSTESASSGPVLMITLLLLSGARHPFNLDASYLAKRSVQVAGNNPYNLSVYKVKELILREWRAEWESKPSSPTAIRLIHFGKVLDDKAAIKDLKFNEAAANVVHMSIKPQDFMEDEDAKGSKATKTQSNHGAEDRSPGCRCSVM